MAPMRKPCLSNLYLLVISSITVKQLICSTVYPGSKCPSGLCFTILGEAEGAQLNKLAGMGLSSRERRDLKDLLNPLRSKNHSELPSFWGLMNDTSQTQPSDDPILFPKFLAEFCCQSISMFCQDPS